MYVDLPLKVSFRGAAWRIPILQVCQHHWHFTTNTVRQMGGQDDFYKLPARTSAKAAFACLTLIKMEQERVGNVISDPSTFLNTSNAFRIPAGAVVQPHTGTEGLIAAEAPSLSPAELPRNPTSIPVPINSKICSTKVLTGYSGLFLSEGLCTTQCTNVQLFQERGIRSSCQVHLVPSVLVPSSFESGSFADSLMGSTETSQVVLTPSLLFIIHSFIRLRQCFTGHVKPRWGSAPDKEGPVTLQTPNPITQ